MGVNTALVRFVYPGPLQGRGFGYNALVVATAFTIGPTIASGILAIGPWTWLFVINVPFGVVAILIGLNTLPRTPRAAHAFDFAGALMAAGCLGLLILGIGSAAHYERSGFISIELASSVLLGWTLIRRQAASPAPVLPIDLFRRPIFARSTATAICSFAVQASLSSPCHSTSRTFSAGRRSRPDFSWPPGLLWWPSLRRSPDVYPTAIPQQFSAASVLRCSALGWFYWRCFRKLRMSWTSPGAWPVADVDWLFSGTEYEGLDVQRTRRSEWKHERHGSDGTPDRTDDRSSPCGALFWPRRPRGSYACARAWSGFRCGWMRDERPASGRHAAKRRLSLYSAYSANE
jgi:hypothetical protein